MTLETGKIESVFKREGNFMHACRSPDENWIAFVSNNGKKYDLFLMKQDGSDLYPLTKDPKEQEYEPRWSRDGKRIYFHKTKKQKGPPFHIWVIISDGSQPFQITFGNYWDLYPDVY